jgi:hypothetical protein
MNHRNPARRLTALVAGPLIAGGLILGGVVVGSPASAGAQPAVGGGCTTMTMTAGQSGPNASALTRAGQIGAAAGPAAASDGAMAVDCQPAGHG